jgi:hypothetical protein
LQFIAFLISVIKQNAYGINKKETAKNIKFLCNIPMVFNKKQREHTCDQGPGNSQECSFPNCQFFDIPENRYFN